MNEQTNDSNYQKGFNEGYIITKHLPELSDKLAQVKNNTPRIEGFQDGRKQLVLEQTKDQRPKWMSFDRSQNTHTDQDHNKESEP